MKLSKLDPMMVLMLVVAFGLVITMLMQNSVASVEGVATDESVPQKIVSTKAMATDTRSYGAI